MSNQEKREALLDQLTKSLEGSRGPVNALDMSDIAQVLEASAVIAVTGTAKGFALHEDNQPEIHEQARRERTNQNLAVDVSANLIPRLESNGGRPTVPEWTISRVTGYTPNTWERLQEIATLASTEDRKVSPAQIASYLVEVAFAGYEIDQTGVKPN